MRKVLRSVPVSMAAASALALGFSSCSTPPVAPPPILTLVSGACQSCLIRTGVLTCWGNQPGDTAMTKDTGAPAPVSLIGFPTAVAIGPDHTCAVVQGKGTYCWGLNDGGQLGIDIPTDPKTVTTTPTLSKMSSLATELVAGQGFTCGLVAGVVKCMGGTVKAELGNGDFTNSPAPITVPLGTILHIAAGLTHACAIDNTNDVYCWGTNEAGQIGPDMMKKGFPQQVVIPKADRLILGEKTSCAHTMDGNIWCWGSNAQGQFGDTTTMDPKPRQTSMLGTFLDFHIGGIRSAGITGVGGIEFWGSELLPNPKNILPPTVVDMVPQAQLVSAGSNFGCAYVAGGSVYCWGDNTCNQLGGAYTGTISPIAYKVL